MNETIRFATVVAALSATSSAAAQTFPAARERWADLRCSVAPMTDPHRDQSGAFEERDIVGTDEAPAAARASDDQYLYLRMRIDGDPFPAPPAKPSTARWAFLIDSDREPRTYEAAIVIDAPSKTVTLHRNTAVSTIDSPDDPPDDPPVASFPVATHARSTGAGTSIGGTADWFLEVAMPWSSLEPLGITRSSSVIFWVVTSATAGKLDGDLACHDGRVGRPNFSGIPAPPRTAPDPDLDSDRDGWPDAVEIERGTNPNDASSRPTGDLPTRGGALALEGAGACAFGRTTTSGAYAFGALLGLVLLRRRRRADPSHRPGDPRPRRLRPE